MHKKLCFLHSTKYLVCFFETHTDTSSSNKSKNASSVYGDYIFLNTVSSPLYKYTVSPDLLHIFTLKERTSLCLLFTCFLCFMLQLMISTIYPTISIILCIQNGINSLFTQLIIIFFGIR